GTAGKHAGTRRLRRVSGRWLNEQSWGRRENDPSTAATADFRGVSLEPYAHRAPERKRRPVMSILRAQLAAQFEQGAATRRTQPRIPTAIGLLRIERERRAGFKPSGG